MIGRRPNVLPNGTHQMFDAPSIKLLTAMRCVSEEKGTMPVGGPLSENVANAVTRFGSALLIIELETLVVNA